MNIQAEFKNGACRVKLIPEDDWEQLLLGALAKGGVEVRGDVTYEPEGHFSYGKAKLVSVLLTAGGEQ